MEKLEPHTQEVECRDIEDSSDHRHVGAAVELAHKSEEQGLSAWTPRMFRLYLVLCVAYLCGCLVSSHNAGMKRSSSNWGGIRMVTTALSWEG